MKVISFLLDLLYPPRCAFCHDFLETGREGVCAHCRTGLPFAQNGGRQHFVAEPVRTELPGAYDIITWVPLSRKRLRERGYDQARLLAKATAKTLGMPLTPTLYKQRNTQPQSGTGDAAKRRANITGAYRMKKGADVTGKRVLLIDDIVTTGSTLLECARVLGKAGAEQVVCATVARAAD